VAPMCSHGTVHWRRLANTIKPFVCGGDAALCQITLTLVIFGHAHLHRHTGSRALQAEYCSVGIPHNTAV